MSDSQSPLKHPSHFVTEVGGIRLTGFSLLACENDDPNYTLLHRTMSRHLHLHILLLVAALAGGLDLLRAADTQFKPLYAGIVPACSCESLTNVVLPNTTI